MLFNLVPVNEAHFENGADLKDPATYPVLLLDAGTEMGVPDLLDPAATDALWRAEAHWDIRSFPTLMLDRPFGRQVLPPVYAPEAVVEFVWSGLSLQLTRPLAASLCEWQLRR